MIGNSYSVFEDIMLVNPDTELTETIIEITHTQGVKLDYTKNSSYYQAVDCELSKFLF